jgi:hypothetical protein
MDNSEDSIFLLESPDAENQAFGTGFAVARRDGRTYLLTCAHVVKQLDDRLCIGELEAEVIADGGQQGIDLALIAVTGLEDVPLLAYWGEGSEDSTIRLRGYSRIDPKKPDKEKRRLDGELGQRTARNTASDTGGAQGEARVWDLSLETDDFSKLKCGYSGSPVYDDQGRVLAVVSERYGGERGHAVCLSNVAHLKLPATDLLPGLGASAAGLDPKVVLTRLMGPPLMEIPSVAPGLMGKLMAMSPENLGPVDQAILQRTLEYLDQGSADAAAFIAYCEGLDKPGVATDNAPDYPSLARRLAQGKVALCLGQDLPILFDQNSPAFQHLVDEVARMAGADPAKARDQGLSYLCEYVELATQHARDEIVDKVRELLSPANSQPPQLPLFQLLAALPKPFLVLSTCYDTLLEASLQNSGRKYALVSPLPSTSPQGAETRLRLEYSDGRPAPKPFMPEKLADHDPMKDGYCLIYKLRGHIYPDQESLLLSERDYLPLTQAPGYQIPEVLVQKLKTGLWYLGHHLDSWEDRLLARVLQHSRQGTRETALVIQPDPDHFTQSFWEKHGAKIHALPPDQFVAGLQAALTKQQADGNGGSGDA